MRVGFGARRILDGVELTVAPGTVLGLLGANGAGKSTLISVATGLRRPDAGRVLVADVDVACDRLTAARHIGFAPQELGVYPTLTARENLLVFAELAGMRRWAARGRAEEVLEVLGLSGVRDRPVGELSGGQQRRVHTGMALVGRPRLLFLDEPTVGADVESRRRILATVRDLAAQGTAVVYTSHIIGEFEELEAEIAVLHEGCISARGTIPELVQRYSSAAAELEFSRAAPQLPGWQRTDARTLTRAGRFSVGAVLSEALALLHERGGDPAELLDVRLRQPGLEDAFLTLTGSAPAADGERAEAASAVDGVPAGTGAVR